MKKSIYVIVISLFTFQIHAQGLDFGIKAGLNIAYCNILSRSTTFNTSNIAAFHGGVYFKFDLSKKISIQPELLYSIQGYDHNTGNADLAPSSRVPVALVLHERLTYLQFPVLFRYNIVPKFNLQAGPQFSYLASAYRTYDYAVGSSTYSTRDQYELGDFGLALGGGFDLPGGLNGGIRYVAGLSNITSINSISIATKNSVIQFYVGMKLK